MATRGHSLRVMWMTGDFWSSFTMEVGNTTLERMLLYRRWSSVLFGVRLFLNKSWKDGMLFVLYSTEQNQHSSPVTGGPGIMPCGRSGECSPGSSALWVSSSSLSEEVPRPQRCLPGEASLLNSLLLGDSTT